MKKTTSVLVVFITAIVFLGCTNDENKLNEARIAYASQDWDKVTELLPPLASKGIAEAQALLGQQFAMGLGVDTDYEEARKWYLKSSNQGYHDMMGPLGFLYADGLGGPKDLILSYMWFDLAVSGSIEKDGEGNAVADYYIGMRDFVAEKLTPEQLNKAKKLVNEWEPS